VLSKTIIRGKKYAVKIIVGIAIGVLFSGNVAQWSFWSRNDQRQAERISELDRQYSEQSRKAGELIGVVSGTLGEIRCGLDSLATALRFDATDLRSIATGVRTAAEEVVAMENYIDYLYRHLHHFAGYFDCEID